MLSSSLLSSRTQIDVHPDRSTAEEQHDVICFARVVFSSSRHTHIRRPHRSTDSSHHPPIDAIRIRAFSALFRAFLPPFAAAAHIRQVLKSRSIALATRSMPSLPFVLCTFFMFSFLSPSRPAHIDQVLGAVDREQGGLRGAARVRSGDRHRRRHRPKPPGRLEQALGAPEAPRQLRLRDVSVVRAYRRRICACVRGASRSASSRGTYVKV